MKVIRETLMDTDYVVVGDIITFTLKDGESVEAMAVKDTPQGKLFVLVDCLKKEYPMFENIRHVPKKDRNYLNSDLRKALNGEILERFPDEIRQYMGAVNPEGDLLRIPTEKEIFGENEYGQDEGEIDRWLPMMKRRNRIAFQGKEGVWEWYWLQNRHKESASDFAIIISDGGAYYNSASLSYGVRPVFLLS